MEVVIPSSRNALLSELSIKPTLCLVKTVFFYLEIFFFYWTPYFWRIAVFSTNFWKITLFLLVEIDFLTCKRHLFLSFLDAPAIVTFIFPSSGNVFLNESCLPVSGKGTLWLEKPFFYLLFRHSCQW